MSPLVGQVTMAVFAALLAAGGVVGMVKAGSRASLIAGLASAFLMIVCLLVSTAAPVVGFGFGAGLSASLVAVFADRFRKTRKFMPSGMLVAVGAIAGVVMAVAAFQAAR